MQTIDFGAGEHKGEAFLKVNPSGQIPALTDGELNVYESAACMRYLACKFKSPLYPFENPKRFAEIDVAYEVRFLASLYWFSLTNFCVAHSPEVLGMSLLSIFVCSLR